MKDNIKKAIDFAYNNKVANMQQEITNAIKDKLNSALLSVKQDIAQNILTQESEEIDEELIDHHQYSQHLKKLNGKVSDKGNTGVLFTFDHPDNAKEFHKILKSDGWNGEHYGTNVHVSNKLKEGLDEMTSPQLHANYKKAAEKDYDKQVSAAHSLAYRKKDTSEPIRKSVNRSKGIVRANFLDTRKPKSTASMKSLETKESIRKKLPKEIEEDVSGDMSSMNSTQFKKKHGKRKRYFRKYFKHN